MVRKYKVEGTREYLYWAIGLGLVSLWFIRDGWFPTEKILIKHPPGTDTFYLFNKTTGIGLIVGSIVCFYIHKVVK